MFYLHSEQHDDFFVLIPTLSLCVHRCECCTDGDPAYAFTLDFLVWSIGIGWAPL